MISNNQFETELKKRIAEEIERINGILAEGQAVKDYADYKHLVGQLFAFNRVINTYCDEVQTEINKR
jgi:hypothetical protein